jgi:hypothetical protein
MRMLLSLLLLTLQLGLVGAPGTCLPGSAGQARQVCGHQDGPGKQTSTHHVGAVLSQNQTNVPVPTHCADPGAWCLAGWLMAGRDTAALRRSADVCARVSRAPDAFLMSIHRSPPVPPPIL